MAQADVEMLRAALIGYEIELKRIKQTMADIQKRLGGRGGDGIRPAPSSAAPKKAKHRISAEGRARIAEAQRRRWANAKKA